jgi:predicted transcriptional regulator
MPTTKTRLNITLSPELEIAVDKLAQRDNTSRAGKATELLRVALEMEEDQVWDELASVRDVKGSVFVSHKKAWG